jgi:hypothetical protein
LNDLFTNGNITGLGTDLTSISFIDLNYPTMHELWSKNRRLRDISIKYDTTKLKFGFTHEGNFTNEICCPKGRYYTYSYSLATTSLSGWNNKFCSNLM